MDENIEQGGDPLRPDDNSGQDSLARTLTIEPPPAPSELTRTLQDWAPLLGWPDKPAWVLAGALAGRPVNQIYTRSAAESIGDSVRGMPLHRPAER